MYITCACIQCMHVQLVHHHLLLLRNIWLALLTAY
jgi:hypothetical protein